MEADMKSITVLIASRPYPLRIKEEDEKRIKGIVKDINDKISKFQMTYAQKDKQDCLAMALLTYAVDLQKQREQTEDSLIMRHLEQIEALVDSAI
jgi:cell division protein ZapA